MPMYPKAVVTIAVLLTVGGTAPAVGEEAVSIHKMRPTADFVSGQIVGDPKVEALKVVSEMSVEQTCGVGANEWCHTSQQTSQTSAALWPVVAAAVVAAGLMALFGRH